MYENKSDKNNDSIKFWTETHFLKALSWFVFNIS